MQEVIEILLDQIKTSKSVQNIVTDLVERDRYDEKLLAHLHILSFLNFTRALQPFVAL